MRRSTLLGLLACGPLYCALQAGAQLTSPVAVEFLGRDEFVTGNPACQGLNPSQLAGVVPQTGWNAIDDQYNVNLSVATVIGANNGITGTLLDTNNNPTGITLSFDANDSWENDVNFTNISSANAILMQGIIKSSASGGVPGVFTFNNVPDGEYDLYVYMDMNGDNTIARVWDFYNVTTNYIREEHQFYDTNVFVQSTATSVAQATNIANYVKFHLGTYGRGQLGVLAQWVSGNDGIGIAGLQIVPTGPLTPNTVPLSFLIEPVSRRGAVNYSNVTFSATVAGPPSYVQWFSNGAAVPGETNLTYTPAPITSAMNAAKIYVQITNNLTSLVSSNVVLTVGQFVTNSVGIGSLDGGIINITTQPKSTSVMAFESGPVTFTVAATASYTGDASGAAPPLSYQWQSAPKGSGSFSPITGATNASYTTPLPSAADDGTQFQVAVNAGGTTVNSSTAVLTVSPDTLPPVVRSAAVLTGSTQVGLSFSEALDPVTATTLSNYKINGAAPVAAYLRTNVANELTSEQNLVSLIAASPVSGSLSVTVSGVKDLSGNAMASTNVTGSVIGMSFAEIGSSVTSLGVGAVGDGTGTNALGNLVAPDPELPGVVTNWGVGSFDVLAQGNDYWNDADGLDFLYEPKTNSFDVRVQVVSVQGADQWSAGAIMMREGPPTPQGAGWELARHYFCKVDYGGPDGTLDNAGNKGANTYEFNCRLAPGNPYLREGGGAQAAAGVNNGATNTAGFSYGWGGAGPGNPSPVPYPNAWIRIARVKSVSGGTTNDHLMGYSSTDGTNWSLRENVDLMDGAHAGWLDITGKPAGPWPDVTYVGLASVSHTGFGNGNATNSVTGAPYQAWIVYRNWGDTPSTTVPTGPTVSIQGNADGTVTITYTGNIYSSTTVNGTYTKVTGAANPLTVNPKTSGNAATFYRAGP